MKRIESRTNPLVKTLHRLARPRKREDRFLLEGTKLVDAARTSGVELETVIVSTAYKGAEPDAVELDERLFREVSSLESPEGILAIAKRPASETPSSGLVAVAAGVQDPGNLGALARVVEASGANGLIVLSGSTDPFSPKAVRGSMGSVLRIPIAEARSLDEIGGFRKIALTPRNGADYRQAEWSSPCAVVLGGESKGLDRDVEAACDERVSIPMHGAVESLNVAMAAAVALYQAMRDQ